MTEDDVSRPVMPPAVRGVWGMIAAVAALVTGVLGVLYAGSGEPGGVDGRIGRAAYGVEAPWRHVALATDFLGEPVGAGLLVVAAVAGCLLLRSARAAVLAVLGPGLAVGATKLLKPVVGRTIHDGHLAYPSGHTAFLTALALVVALLVAGRRRRGPAAGTALVLGAALAAGAAMGWAQVALGAHYPSDALGGWCVALAVAPAGAWLVDRAADQRAAGRGAGRASDATRPAAH
ncbi:phosphatase PAP2 family protein [Streptomyces sp. JJ38]|uniref:phosphatase PAP2 family protein n=1 Tax=Streptomyces sp. JJ38 TaxID=2738128 RepID=UPI001C5A192A|nr:phosphatase PAP2 family protein [Streptomyces sp. JJ38]MBW1595652.1 phosphatase PAP2 family protein [Streptomyces sp. JJ38]